MGESAAQVDAANCTDRGGQVGFDKRLSACKPHERGSKLLDRDRLVARDLDAILDAVLQAAPDVEHDVEPLGCLLPCGCDDRLPVTLLVEKLGDPPL